MAKGQRRNSLEIWLQAELPLRFEGRILAIDQQVANAWGRIAARRMAIGRPISVMDAFIAATAEVHNLTLVTHNTSDFASIVKGLINPWTRES
jgi:predicted nucleic acid-binding protein